MSNRQQVPGFLVPLSREDIPNFFEFVIMENLPDEVLLLLLGHLNWYSLPQAKLVCKRWNAVGSDPLVPRLIRRYKDSSALANCFKVRRNWAGIVKLQATWRGFVQRRRYAEARSTYANVYYSYLTLFPPPQQRICRYSRDYL